MANKCLVTRLKATVDNPNLPKFGAFTLYAKNSTNTHPSKVIFNSDAELKIIGDPTLTITIEGVERHGGETISGKSFKIKSTEKSEGLALEFNNMYQLTSFEDAGGYGIEVHFDFTRSIETFNNTSRLKYLSQLSNIDIPHIKGSASELAEMLQYRTNPEATSLWMYQNFLTGELKDLAPMIYLTSLNIQDISSNPEGNLLGGTVEDFAAAQVAHGRTSGTLELFSNNTVTYNGNTNPSSFWTITYDSSLPGGYSIE